MTSRTPLAVTLAVLAQWIAGCGVGVSPTPLPPVPVQAATQQTPAAPCTSPATFYGCAYERRDVTGAYVYCEACGLQTHTWATADSNGFYSFSGDIANGGGVWLSPGFLTAIGVEHPAYQDPSGLPPLRGPMFQIPSGAGWREVLIDGDTRLDIQLVRR